MGIKNRTISPHHIFSNILKRDDKFYDKVNIVPKFFCRNYGARIRPWGLPLKNNGDIWTFRKCQNPGGDLEIWDFCVTGVWTLWDRLNSDSISKSTIFGYKIILKIRIFIFLTEISKSKYPALPPIRAIPQYQERGRRHIQNLSRSCHRG